jgi:phage terminase large subunit-like protein
VTAPRDVPVSRGRALDKTSLAYWRKHIVEFIEAHLINPETGQPYRLYPAEKLFLAHMFETAADGRLVHTDLVYSCGKKGGKTEFGAMVMLVMILLFGGRFGEGYCVANDLEQATSRVFERCRRIVEASPLLRSEAKVGVDRIVFPATGATITALASNYSSVAGAHPVLAVFDEIWGYTSERGRRLWDELVPVPSRKISARLVVSHAGFTGESDLLFDLYQRGLKQPEIAPQLYSGDGQLMFWTHEPISPLQEAAWLADMRRKLRPAQYLRMIENRFTSGETSFVEPAWWDACTDLAARPLFADNTISIWIGVDASTKRDTTAIVAVSWDAKINKVRLISHRIFAPTPDDPLDFEATVESTLRDWCRRFAVREVRFDPYQMASVAQRLAGTGVPMLEYPQTVANLTAMGSNLYELIKSANLVAYPDADLRLAISRTVAKETARGYQLTKEKASHKIDVVVALAMAALAAVEGGQGISLWERASAETLGRVLADVDAMPRYRWSPSFREGSTPRFP